MNNPTDQQIATRLAEIISDGVNRSLAVLEESGAIDTTKLKMYYTGNGSKFYDIVTVQIEKTAQHGVPSVRDLFTAIRHAQNQSLD